MRTLTYLVLGISLSLLGAQSAMAQTAVPQEKETPNPDEVTPGAEDASGASGSQPGGPGETPISDGAASKDLAPVDWDGPTVAPPADPSAQLHLREAVAAESRADYPVAADRYGRVYRITKDPVVLFRIAEAFHRAGNCQNALAYYGRYVREAAPSPRFQKVTDGRMVACGSAPKPAIAEETSEPPTRTEEESEAAPTQFLEPEALPPGTEPQRRTSGYKSAAWVSVGVAVALGTAGAVLGLSASSREDDVKNQIGARDSNDLPNRFQGEVQERYEDLVSEGRNLDIASKIAFGAAGAAAVASVLFFVLDPGEQGGVTPRLEVSASRIQARWRF